MTQSSHHQLCDHKLSFSICDMELILQLSPVD